MNPNVERPPRPAHATGPVVFLSYSRADRALGERLLTDLEQAGHAGWLDTTDIPGGEVWIKAIAEGLERAYSAPFAIGRTGAYRVIYAHGRGCQIKFQNPSLGPVARCRDTPRIPPSQPNHASC